MSPSLHGHALGDALVHLCLQSRRALSCPQALLCAYETACCANMLLHASHSVCQHLIILNAAML